MNIKQLNIKQFLLKNNNIFYTPRKYDYYKFLQIYKNQIYLYHSFKRVYKDLDFKKNVYLIEFNFYEINKIDYVLFIKKLKKLKINFYIKVITKFKREILINGFYDNHKIYLQKNFCN